MTLYVINHVYQLSRYTALQWSVNFDLLKVCMPTPWLPSLTSSLSLSLSPTHTHAHTHTLTHTHTHTHTHSYTISHSHLQNLHLYIVIFLLSNTLEKCLFFLLHNVDVFKDILPSMFGLSMQAQ